ncbi:SCO1860 family LAETG-anchored protein [Streptomyces monashensis]|uniref:SCO1860 family LAETG-anchored protein n=1 Tax=Streptomyces monashensis TaxID=1678012 RepID=UPI000D1A0B65|nr:SCO1860 family LAETG-anchored protein [Streptomyces monashensis]
MTRANFRMPARRLAAVATVTALAAAPAVLGAGAAHATGDHGRASAVVLRTGLDVSLLNKTVDVPLTVSLNEVRAPRSADRTALSARLDGVDGGRPFTVLGADVASAKATVTARRAEGSVRLAHARLHLPGLPLLSLIEADTVTAQAVCEAGRTPVAAANVLGGVTVLGKRVTLTAGGPTEVKVPGVGEVRLDLSQRRTTTRTAAATALRLTVSVNPPSDSVRGDPQLNVADVEGTVTLAQATCESPTAASSGDPVPSHDPAAGTASKDAAGKAAPASDVKPQGGVSKSNLAETGGSSATPYLAGGALALVLAGGGAVALARRRRS